MLDFVESQHGMVVPGIQRRVHIGTDRLLPKMLSTIVFSDRTHRCIFIFIPTHSKYRYLSKALSFRFSESLNH